VFNNENKTIGAEPGSIFIEFENHNSANKASIGSKGRRYQKRAVKTTLIDESVYRNNIIIGSIQY
jgi:hypothetical protein